MVTITNDSYSCASGGVISAGRYASKRVAIWGQSNAIGRADTSDINASPLTSDPALYSTYWLGGFDRVYIWTGAAFAKLSNQNNLCDTNQFGPEFGLAVRWMRETTAGNLYIEKDGVGGVEIAYWDKDLPYYYATALAHRAASNSWLATNGISVIDSAFVWIQGEGDDTHTESYYTTQLNELLTNLVADGVVKAGEKRLLFQIPAGTVGYSAGIVAAKNAVAAANPTTTSAPAMPNYMKADNLHQNGRGQVQVGYDIYEYVFGGSHIAV